MVRGFGQAKLSATCLMVAACSSTIVIIRRLNVLRAKRKGFLTAYENVNLEGTKITISREHTRLSVPG